MPFYFCENFNFDAIFVYRNDTMEATKRGLSYG